ncbi:MAG: ABC transporter ATP-binding protein [Planctomycetota bacterium]|nr:ABC transporter ATP-binding protein [Planctomycetota bacterium]
MIELIDVHKTLGGKKVLVGMNLSIKRGETYTVIGRSGIGKSVTLKHIVGVMKPDKGRVIVDGVEVQNLNRRQLERFRVKFGYLFQSSALLNSLNVFENVALPLREHTRMSEEEIQERVVQKLSLVGLKGTEKMMPSDLSGGMRKRVALARAIVMEPEVILYDEPTTGLDPITADAINGLIRDMQQRLKVTSVVVTHDMKSAYKISDRIGLLHEGRIIQEGTPDNIKDSNDPRVKQFINGEAIGPLTTSRD